MPRITRGSTAFALLIAFGACRDFGPDAGTGLLAGTVVRGPVTPVCQIDVPCDAPFSASFVVLRGSVQAAMFHSAADGSFSVLVPAGTLTIVPAADAPIIDPGQQMRTVAAEPGVTTTVHLVFDTGIR
ncbi:MAG TPA: hypothetical protein VF483_06825 [Gemmatimonadaceae bacterium]